ncbi:MAG: hypothetical protein AB7V45_07990 [Candidatus Krumholzibacteriia bacterium]
MRPSLFFPVLAALCLAPAAWAGDGLLPDAETVLQTSIEAMGGRDAILAVETRHYRGRRVDDLGSKDPPVTETVLEIWATADGEILVKETAAGEEPVVRDLAGSLDKLAWLLHPHGPLLVGAYFPDLVVKERVQRHGRWVDVLESPGLDGTSWSLAFDVETGLLNHIGYSWDLLDYRPEGDVNFAHTIVTSRKGGSSTFFFEEIETNGKRPEGF